MLAVKIVGVELPNGVPVQMLRAPTTPVKIVGVDVPSSTGSRNTVPVTFSSDLSWTGTYPGGTYRPTPHYRR